MYPSPQGANVLFQVAGFQRVEVVSKIFLEGLMGAASAPSIVMV